MRLGRSLAYAGSALLHAGVLVPLLLARPAERPQEPVRIDLAALATPEQQPPAAEEQQGPVSEPVQAAPPPEPQQAEAPPPEPVQMAAIDSAEPPPPDAQPAPEPDPEPLHSLAPEPVPVAELPPPPPPRQPEPTPPRPRPVARPRTVPTPVANAAPQPAPAPPAAAQPAPPARPSPNYIGALMAALERHKQYPGAARFRRAEGTAMLRFRMGRDGRVLQWQLDRSSGDADLDSAVAAMIRAASPLPAPPQELGGEVLELVVPVRFALRS